MENSSTQKRYKKLTLIKRKNINTNAIDVNIPIHNMRAAVRSKFTNNLFYTTFAVAFITVAGGSVVPCPAHGINNEDEKSYNQVQDSKKNVQN